VTSAAMPAISGESIRRGRGMSTFQSVTTRPGRLDTPVLLMDEPFGALDAMTRDTLHEELEALVSTRRTTVVFVTHNVREAARLGDRIVVMSPRPGRVTNSIDVPIERPRRIDSAEVSALARTVTDTMREEVLAHARR
jgi:NitT/TauT family transport system ATP-binding protein